MKVPVSCKYLIILRHSAERKSRVDSWLVVFLFYLPVLRILVWFSGINQERPVKFPLFVFESYVIMDLWLFNVFEVWQLTLLTFPLLLRLSHLWVPACSVAQLCPTLCDPMDYTVHGILQARILERGAFPFSRWSFQPRDRIQVFCIVARFFTNRATGEALSPS